MRLPALRAALAALVLLALLSACGSAPTASGTEAGSKDDGQTSPTTSASRTPKPDSTGLPTQFQTTSPRRPVLGRPFIAAIATDTDWIEAKVTLTSVTPYDGNDFPELKGRPLLMRWKAENIDDHPLVMKNDIVTQRFAAVDSRKQWARGQQYYAGSAISPDGCQTQPDDVTWKSGQTLRGCGVQTLAPGTSLRDVLFLYGVVNDPGYAQFRLPAGVG